MPEFFGRRSYLILVGLIFISMAILTIHFREGDDGMIHKSQRTVMAATSPIQASVTGVFSPIQDGWDYLVHFGELKRENNKLKKDVAKLRAEISALRDLKSENTRLRKLIDFSAKGDYSTVAAHVIGMPASNWRSSVIIDKGFASGVNRSMPAVAGGGLIGQVVDASSNAAKVVLLNDVQSGVSVQVRRTGELGVIKGRLKDQRLVLNYIPKDSTIKKGDAIVTSGLGGIFPKGIYVGKVVKVRQTPYNLYKIVEVAAPVDFSKLEEVLVITDQIKTPLFGEGK